MTLKWNHTDQSDSKATTVFYRLLYTCWWLAILVLFMLYELSIVWWPFLSLLMFHVTASQLFVNCWVRATASIVRAKRFYSDDILTNLFENILFFGPPYKGYFWLQSKTALPVHCSDRFMENGEKPLENKGFLAFWGTLKFHILDPLFGWLLMTQSDPEVT